MEEGNSSSRYELIGRNRSDATRRWSCIYYTDCSTVNQYTRTRTFTLHHGLFLKLNHPLAMINSCAAPAVLRVLTK